MAVRRRLWLLLVPAALLLFWLAGDAGAAAWDALRLHGMALMAWVGSHRAAAMLAYVMLYVAVAALCIPGTPVLTVAGGLFFGTLGGTALTAAGASLGAVLAFLAARAAFRTTAAAGTGLDRLGRSAALLAEGLRRNAWSYLLVARLLPVFPFVLVNLVPALLGVRLRVYVATTVLGVVPTSFLFSLAGEGLRGAVRSGAAPDPAALLLSPAALIALCGLAALSLGAVPLRARLLRKGAG